MSGDERLNDYYFILFIVCTGAQYQFTENDYLAFEHEGSSVRVVVQQISASLVNIHLKLTPYTYDQYTQRANQSGSTLEPLDEFHGSRPDPAECKYEKNDLICTHV